MIDAMMQPIATLMQRTDHLPRRRWSPWMIDWSNSHRRSPSFSVTLRPACPSWRSSPERCLVTSSRGTLTSVFLMIFMVLRLQWSLLARSFPRGVSCSKLSGHWRPRWETCPNCEKKMSPIVRAWRMLRIPIARLPLGFVPLWRRWRSCLQAGLRPSRSCLQVSPRPLVEPPTCFRINSVLIFFVVTARNGSMFFLGPCQVLVVQSFAFSFRLSEVRSLIEWLLRSFCTYCENPMLRILNSFSSCGDIDVRLQGDSVAWHYVFFLSTRCRCERGSYSARVPRSSLAGVHRVFVFHILEEEAEDPENEQDDSREERQQEVEGRIAESQNNHIMSAWRWDGVKCALHAKLELEPWATCVIKCVVTQRENVTCEVCCSHPPLVAADCYQL